jgi:hypothetical protein
MRAEFGPELLGEVGLRLEELVHLRLNLLGDGRAIAFAEPLTRDLWPA